MTKNQKRVITLYKIWKRLERQAEMAYDSYQANFGRLTDEELTDELVNATQ
jgi:hypothetical protein